MPKVSSKEVCAFLSVLKGLVCYLVVWTYKDAGKRWVWSGGLSKRLVWLWNLPFVEYLSAVVSSGISVLASSNTWFLRYSIRGFGVVFLLHVVLPPRSLGRCVVAWPAPNVGSTSCCL